MIKVENLTYLYTSYEGKKNKAVDDISFCVNKGEFVSIIGHNGSGKSTLAKLLNGILTPSSGDITIGGLNTKDEANIWNIRQKAGMVFQNPDNQMVATIVEEDIAFGPENLGLDPEIIGKRVESALKTLNMYEYKDKKPHELSGGQKQRIAIASILAMEPECIILDEPTAMLDPIGRSEVIEVIKRLNRENNTTIILITHYMDEIVDCDRVIIMDKGSIAINDTPREVFKNKELLNSLSLEPPFATEIAYELNEIGIKVDRDVLSIDELVEGICQLKQSM